MKVLHLGSNEKKSQKYLNKTEASFTEGKK